MQIEVNRHLPSRPATELNILEAFNIALPDFMSLYGVAAIVKESGLLPLLNFNDGLVAFELFGDLSGFVIVEEDSPSTDNSDIIKESVNIILGQTLSRIKKSNLNSLLSPPSIQRELFPQDYETKFKIKYLIESDKIKTNITLSFLLNKEV